MTSYLKKNNIILIFKNENFEFNKIKIKIKIKIKFKYKKCITMNIITSLKIK